VRVETFKNHFHIISNWFIMCICDAAISLTHAFFNIFLFCVFLKWILYILNEMQYVSFYFNFANSYIENSTEWLPSDCLFCDALYINIQKLCKITDITVFDLKPQEGGNILSEMNLKLSNVQFSNISYIYTKGSLINDVQCLEQWFSNFSERDTLKLNLEFGDTVIYYFTPFCTFTRRFFCLVRKLSRFYLV